MSTTPTLDPLTLEDVAHFADASGELPDDTATRLQALVCCDDPEQIQDAWRLAGSHLEALRQTARDAGVDLLEDAIFVFRIFEKLRSESWERPEEVLPHGVEVPYQPLISIVGAYAERAAGTERAELRQLRERLISALGHQLGDEAFVQQLIDRLLRVGEEAAEEILGHLMGLYRQRRRVATIPNAG